MMAKAFLMGKLVGFKCPACKTEHYANLATDWTFDGNLDSPTITPSVNVAPNGKQPRCHGVVTAGQIFFMPDTGHELVGQTVGLLDV